MKTPHARKSPLVAIGRIPFFGRIIRSILIHVFRTFRLEYLVVPRMGALFLVDQENKVDRSLLIKGEWEQDQITRLKQLIQQQKPNGVSSTFLDIGAHGGLYSILVSQSGGFDRMLALEPDKINMAQLYANLFINNLAGEVSVIPAAAANRSGVAGFVSCHGRDRGLSHLQPDSGGGEGESVDTIRIDDLVKQQDGFIAAKIDVEGYEKGVLEGMEQVIRSNACVLQIEIKDDASSLIPILSSYGLQPAAQIHHDHYFVKPAPPPREDPVAEEGHGSRAN